MRSISVVSLLVAGAGLLAASPQRPRAVAPAPALASLQFMSGCWQGLGADGALIQESYTASTADLMLGMTRYVRSGKVVDYEFTIIAERDRDLVMTPHPKGQQSASFRLKELERGRAVWVNPEHDFPQQISYQKLGGDTLRAAIAGPQEGKTQTIAWAMARVACGR